MTRHIQNRIKIREKQGGRCGYCLRPMVLSDKPPHKQPRNAETLEHLRRRSNGGRNNRDNIALACKHINEERGAAEPHQRRDQHHRPARSPPATTPAARRPVFSGMLAAVHRRLMLINPESQPERMRR
ncbi:HNH endonuclease [Rhizobium leguminosarum]|nr:HNH endonuclease [Rhizobium leguminosarum]